MRKGSGMMKLIMSLLVFAIAFWVVFKVENHFGLLNGKQG